jgi:hypothetical protein
LGFGLGSFRQLVPAPRLELSLEQRRDEGPTTTLDRAAYTGVRALI